MMGPTVIGSAYFVNFMLFFTICRGANELPYLMTPPTVTMEYSTPTNLTVEWLPWTTDGGGDGPVTGYEVVYRYESAVDGDTSYDNSLAVDSNETTSVVISGLDVDKEYDLAIVVIGEGGVKGPSTNKTTVKTDCAAPTAAATVTLTTISPSEIFVSWELPPPVTWGCREIEEKAFLQFKKSSDSFFQWMFVDGAPASYNLTSLNPCVDYDVQVYFSTPVFRLSPVSQLATATTPKTEPPPVAYLNVNNAPDSLEFQVTWTESGLNTAECVEQYRISNTPLRMVACESDIVSPMTSVEVVPANATSVRFGDLTAYTEYNVTVTASNDIGNSSVRFVTKTSRSTVPAILPAVRFTDITEWSVRIAWDRMPCEDVHGSFLQYLVLITNNATGTAVRRTVYGIDSSAVVQSNLLPCGTYDVKIAAESSSEVGPYSESVQFTTLPTVPYVVSNHAVTSLDDNPHALLVTWEPPSDVTCPIDYYQVSYKLIGRYQCQTVPDGERIIAANTTTTSHTITGLLAYSLYFVYITAHTEAGLGQEANAGYDSHETAEKVPTVPPDRVLLEFIDKRRLSFSWLRPACSGASSSSRLLRYAYKLVNLDNTSSEPVYGVEEGLTVYFDNLLPYTRYAFQVLMQTNAGDGPYSEPVNGTTLADVPGPPTSLSVTNKTETTVTIKWQAPTVTNGVIVYYTVQYKAIEKPYDPNFFPDYRFTELALLGPDNFTSTLTWLDPGTKYEIRVAGLTPPGEGEFVSVEVFTDLKTDIPEPHKPDIDPSRTTDTSVYIYLSSPDDTYVTSYLVAVKKMSLSRTKRESIEIDGDTYGTHGENPNAYIAAEILKKDNDGGFVVGDGKMYGDYLNAPLGKGNYSIQAGGKSLTDEMSSFSWSTPVVASLNGPTEGGTSPGPGPGPNPTDPPVEGHNSVGIIAGVVVVVVLIVAIVGFVVFYLNRKNKREVTTENEMAMEERKMSSVNA